VALAVQQSLFEGGGGTPMVGSARWVESVMLGEIALGLCVIAVAFTGAMMLTGRLPLREGVRVALGCFVLLGAPVIAAGLTQGGSGLFDASSSMPPGAVQSEMPRADLPPANYDPYAGASLGQD
jgi:type IV secretory pathway VirB2 component (pilin)